MPVSTPYADNCRCAVSLTFDDGLESQLAVALPMLNERGLKATLYISPMDSRPGAGDWAERTVRWKDALSRGHEIGNHTLSHICSRAFLKTPRERHLETMTLEEIEADVLEAERRLNEVLGSAARSFAYPCYQSHVGDGVTRRSYVPVIAKHFIAARCKGEYANFPSTCSMSYLWSYPCERMSGQAMIELIERAAEQEQWCILTFHGIDVGHLPVHEEDFRQVCDYLARNTANIWTAPVIDIAKRIIDWRNRC